MVHASLLTLMCVAVLTLSSINFGTIFPKFQHLQDWQKYNDCVDSYMQISDSQMDQLSVAQNAVIAQLSIACTAAFFQLFVFFITLWVLCRACKNKNN